MSKGGKLYVAVLATAGAILTYQLFIPPIVGLADQGDFVRTIRRFGYDPQHHGSLGYVYVEPKYIPDPHSRSSDWEQANSEYLFVGAALLLNKVVSKDGALDITVAGFVHALAFLAAFARLLWVGRHHQAYVLLWIGALVALTDAGYAVYWNSFYAEPASCIFFLLLLAEGVESARTGETSLAGALRWSLWSVLWILAKPQNAPIGLILGLFTFRLAMWTPSNPARMVAAVGSCAMFAGAAFNAVAVPTYGHQANTYGMVFSGILPESKNPEADLRALGLDPQLAKYSGTGAWTPKTYFPQIAASGALKRVNTLAVLGFYLVRPARMWRRLHGLLPEITFLRWNSYGNFELSAGLPPAAQSRAFTLWSGFHEHILPSVNKWIVFALAGWPLVAAWRWGRDRDLARRRRLELLTLLPVCCLAALFSAVYGDAFDVIKHMYLFNLLLDTCILYIAAAGWNWAAINLLDSNAIGTRVMRMLHPSTPLGRTTLWFISGVSVLIALRWIVYIEFPRPPLVRITSPQSLAVFGAGDSIPLSVSAQYPAGEGGSIQVMLSGLAGRNMVVCGGPATACRSTMWDQAPPGNYTLQASLFDPSGALIATSGNAVSFSVSQTLAAGAQVRVITKSNQPPSTTAQTPVGPLVNAGSFVGPVAPGALVSVFVSVGTLPITQATSLPLPTTLSGLALAINGRSTPLLYASGTQVNAQLPYEVSPGNYTASLSLNTAVTHTFSCTVTPAAPGIFTFGNNRAVAQNQDYTVNGVNNPAKAGSVITLYFTGQGVPDNAVATGEAALLPPAPLSATPATVSATIGGQPVALFFVGLTPKFVGLSQANIRIPASLPPGTYPSNSTWAARRAIRLFSPLTEGISGRHRSWRKPSPPRRRGVARCSTRPDSREHSALNALAEVYFYSHRLDELEECAGEALRIARYLGDDRLRVETMVFIAMRQDIVGELGQAKCNLDDTIRVARALDFRRALLDALAWRGQLHFFQSEYECAQEVLREALDVASEVRHGPLFLQAQFFLGLSLGNMGRFSEALAVLKEATALL